ncbi:hypothetical protein [Phormidium nigroviride]
MQSHKGFGGLRMSRPLWRLLYFRQKTTGWAKVETRFLWLGA